MFQEFVLTLVVIFVLFKLFGQNNSGNNYTQNNFNSSEKKSDGKVRVDYIPKSKNHKKSNTNTAGDYVDYEEIK